MGTAISLWVSGADATAGIWGLPSGSTGGDGSWTAENMRRFRSRIRSNRESTTILHKLQMETASMETPWAWEMGLALIVAAVR